MLELKECLREVDLDKLWDRLVQGLEADEEAVDSQELMHLFGGSEKDSRLFIDRVCNLAKMERVHVKEKHGTEVALKHLTDTIYSLEQEFHGCQDILEDSYDALLPALYPEDYQEEDAKYEIPDITVTTGLAALATREDEEETDLMRGAIVAVGSDGRRKVSGMSPYARKKVLKSAMTRRPPNSVFNQPPKPGELRTAAAVLSMKKKQSRQVQTFVGGNGAEVNISTLSTPAVDAFIHAPHLENTDR